MSPEWIWLAAAVVYAAFRAWYDNWRGPIRPDEIEAYLARVEGTSTGEVNDVAVLRRFLEKDDGREFVMLNLVRLAPEPVSHPTTGEPTSAGSLIRAYMGGFLPTLLRHGGVPLLQARKIGPYVDAWGVEPDPGWTIVGCMRYRSRRDMIELVTESRFLATHGFKIAALPNTLSFPTRYELSGFLGPRIWIALVLALMAALTHLVIG